MHASKIIFIIISIVSLLACCQDKTCTKKNGGKPINPNGDSELALLMREMLVESDSLRQLISEGKKLSDLRRFREIHSATPTDSTVSGSTYEAFAQAYIESIKELETAGPGSVLNFNNMVDKCMNCHSEFCPGPRKRIRKLYLEE